MDKNVFEAGHRRQKRGVCVLRSYAAAVSPHVPNTNPDEVLAAYCREYQRDPKDVDDAEKLVETHFGPDYVAKKRNGYEHLVVTHTEGKDAVFQSAANAVAIKPLQSQDPFQEMEEKLRAQPGSTAIMCLLPDQQAPHSVAVAFDASQNCFLVSDPNVDTVQECASPVFLDDATKKPIQIGTILILEPIPQPLVTEKKAAS